MSDTPNKREKSFQKSQEKSTTNIRGNRKRNYVQSQNTIDTEFVQPLPSTSNDISNLTNSMEKSNLGRQKKPDFFDKKSDISATKHGILSSYLGAWFSILSNFATKLSGSHSYSRLVYIDGFAGPGRYKKDNEHGSPLVAYTLALNHNNLPQNGPEIDLIFIEWKGKKSQDLLENLKKTKTENETAKNVNKVKFMVINAKFKPAMHWILSDSFIFKEDGFQQNVPPETSQTLNRSVRFVTGNTPLFVFVDPFGYKGEDIPMDLMQKIMRTTNKAEILINLMTGSLQRFCEDPSKERAINLLVGQDENDATWKPIVLQEDNDTKLKQMQAFLDHYREKISEDKNAFVTIFEVRDNMNRLKYNLFYVCRHPTSFVKMKEAMRKCSQSDMKFKYSTFEAKRVDFKRQNLEVEDLVQAIVRYFNREEFQGQTIVGRQITELINNHPVVYQKYRVELKHHLNAFCTGTINGGSQKFDEMTFKFIPHNDN